MDLLLEELRVPEVVTVEQREERALGRRDSAVPRRGSSGVRLPDQVDTGPAFPGLHPVVVDLAYQALLLSAGLDEVPGVYKDIAQVMAAQTDLVDVLGRFDPKLVKMCPAGERAED